MKKYTEEKSELPNRLIGFREVRHHTGLSRATVWRMERAGKFPRRRRITASKVAWRLDEVLRWIDEREIVEVKIKTVEETPVPKLQQPAVRQRHWTDRDDD